MELTIRKSTGLDDVLGRIKLQQMETVKPVSIFPPNSPLEQAWQLYLQLFENDKILHYGEIRGVLCSYFFRAPVLNHTELAHFLQGTVGMEGNDRRHQNYTGRYISTLLEISYLLGKYNNFSFDLSNIQPLDYFGEHLSGEKSRKIVLSLHGNLGNGNFYAARNLHLKLACSKIGEAFGHASCNCYFDFGKDEVKFAPRRSFLFEGINDCTIVTSNLNNFNFLTDHIFTYAGGGRGTNNFLILTDINGQELTRYNL